MIGVKIALVQYKIMTSSLLNNWCVIFYQLKPVESCALWFFDEFGLKQLNRIVVIMIGVKIITLVQDRMMTPTLFSTPPEIHSCMVPY